MSGGKTTSKKPALKTHQHGENTTYTTETPHHCGEQACPALGCAAAPKQTMSICLKIPITWSGAAARPSASKLAHHRGLCCLEGGVTKLIGLPGWLFGGRLSKPRLPVGICRRRNLEGRLFLFRPRPFLNTRPDRPQNKSES